MMKLLGRMVSARTLSLVLVEFILIVLAVDIAALLRLGPVPLRALNSWTLRAMVVAAVLQWCLHYADLYDLRRLSDRRDTISRLLQALGAACVILAIVYYWIPQLMIGRGVFALATTLVIAFSAGWRIAFEWMARRGRPVERLLIVGTSAAAVTLARELFERRAELGVDLVGFVDQDPRLVGQPMINPGVIGVVGEIPEIVKTRKVDRVVVSLADARGKLDMDALLAMKINAGVRFDHLASVYEQYTGKIAVENLRPSWLIFSDGFTKSTRFEAAKRVLDLLFAGVALIIAAPVVAMAAAAIRMTSRGPVLYAQTRVGKGGAPFTIYKFRSMRVDAEQMSGAVWSPRNDPRVTGLGRFLRRSRLDELPQLWNVLRGDMSFVGPRPERPEFIAELTRRIPYYGQRHVVRPGLTGWAQVRHSYGSTVEDAQEKLQYELFYIKHMSVPFDLYIVLETVKTVLMRAGS
jgi:sugar transferase (PEP-CTERM system associated)